MGITFYRAASSILSEGFHGKLFDLVIPYTLISIAMRSPSYDPVNG
jgi:hypothetical protein